METITNKSTINQKIIEDIDKSIQEKQRIDLLNTTKPNYTSKTPEIYGASLYKLLNLQKSDSGYIDNKTLLKLTVTIPFERVKREVQNSSMSVIIDKEGQDTAYNSNGKKLTEEDIKILNQDIVKESKNYIKRKRQSIIKALKAFKIANKNLIDSKFIDTAIKEGKNTFEIELKKSSINNFVEKNSKYITIIDTPQKLEPTVALAMESTKIDPYAIDYGRTGAGIGIHIGELNCPNTTHISNYTRLSGNCTPSNTHHYCKHSRSVTAIARAVSPNSHIYCKSTNGILPTNSERSNIQIESYSIRSSTYERDYTSFDKDIDNEAYDHLIPTFVAAGNHDEDDTTGHTWNVVSPAKGFNTITVGNYNKFTDEINLDNDQGSAHIDPKTSINKPEVVAPGTYITAGGTTMTGTSQAAPHAAAFAADLMGEYSWLKYRPYLLKSLLLASSTKDISGDDSTNAHGDVGNRTGVGGIDFYDAAYSGYFHWWIGSGSYEYHASHDDGSMDDKIEATYYIPSGMDMRISISWLNDGDYTLNHRNDAHPIGKDFDLYVYDSVGNLVEGSTSYDNSYEVVNFTTTKSDDYKIVINLYEHRDTNTALYLALSVNW